MVQRGSIDQLRNGQMASSRSSNAVTELHEYFPQSCNTSVMLHAIELRDRIADTVGQLYTPPRFQCDISNDDDKWGIYPCCGGLVSHSDATTARTGALLVVVVHPTSKFGWHVWLSIQYQQFDHVGQCHATPSLCRMVVERIDGVWIASSVDLHDVIWPLWSWLRNHNTP